MMTTQDAPRIRKPSTTVSLIRRPQTVKERETRAAKSAATSRARGATLWFEGYTMTPTSQWAVYLVTTPERINKDTGEVYVKDYTVDVMLQTCNCDDFLYNGSDRVCKHLAGADNAISEAGIAADSAAVALRGESARPTWNTGMLPAATLSAMSRAGVLNRAADFD